MKLRISGVVVAFLLFVLSLAAQTASSGSASSQVPPLIQLSNVATDQGGNTLSGVVSITFSLYAAQQGGEALWTETQNNVQLDATGHYSVQLGVTKSNGVPATLFTSGEARWLGVEIAERGEQPRVLLLSVPYALKAGDAATIGGLPPSAFVLAAPANGSSAIYATAAVPETAPPPAAEDVTTAGGTINYLPLFNGTSTILDSAIFQSATAPFKIGINTTTPATTLDVKGAGTIRGSLTLPATGTATATAGKISQALNLVASSFDSTSSTALNQTFRWQAEPAANNTGSPSGTLHLLYGLGATTPGETELYIASNGLVTFADGQTFPGAGSGTVTSVATGLGLKGGTITASGTLKIDTTVVPQLGAINTFTTSQAIEGTVSATTVGNAVAGTATGTSGGTIGVLGNAASPSGYGVYGTNSAATGSATGVYGTSSSSAGYGVEGQSPHIGVYSSTAAGTAGTYGLYQSRSATGSSSQNFCIEDCDDFPISVQLNMQAGVWADTNWDGETNASDIFVPALLATADANMAGVFLNNASETPALLAWGLGTGGGEVSDVLRAGSPAGSCSFTGSGDTACTGTLKSVVATTGSAGKQRVETYSVQSAENWFEDAGTAQLVNGAARVDLESVFGKTVNTGVEYHVFLTPDGDCKGLYISAKTGSGFEVRELGGGASSIAFEYRIMAKRVGYENVRLKNVTARFNKQAAQRQNIRRPLRPSAAPLTSPQTRNLPVSPARAAVQPVSGQSR
jgi:hypothetical protein